MVKASESQATFAKLMLFGDWGSGKTFFIIGLLEAGHKVLVIVTDVGGDGLNTIRLEMRRRGKPELLDNLFVLELKGDEEVQDFLSKPDSFFPEIYDCGVDVLFWDGFSTWQQVDASETVGDYAAQRGGENSNKQISEAITSGNQVDMQGWGQIRNMTVRAVDKFCALSNMKTGQPWHKVVTCQEGWKQVKKGDKAELVESKMPLLQGAGGKIIGGAFDLIIRTDKEYKDNQPVYVYKIDQENLSSKNRGFQLPPVMPADPGALWAQVRNDLGI